MNKTNQTWSKDLTDLKLSQPGMFGSPDANALLAAVNEIIPNLGNENFRFSGDIALKIRTVLNQAGFKIVRKPKGKTLISLHQDGKL